MKRNWKYDFMRICMSLLVIIVHVSSYAFYVQGLLLPVPAFYNALGRVAVPVFYMTMGALGFTRQETIGKVYKRMLRRIVLPLLCASAVFLLYRYLIAAEPIWPSLARLVTTPAYYHLSFMYVAIALYLVMPLFQAAWAALDGHAKLPLALLSCALAALQAAGLLSIIAPLPEYLAYALLGAALQDAFQQPRRFLRPAWWKAAVCLVLSLGFTAWTAYLVFHSQLELGYVDQHYLAYSQPLVMGAAISAYLAVLLLPIVRVSERTGRFLARWDRLTLGVYLIHPLFVEVLQNGQLQLNGTPLRLGWDTFRSTFAIPVTALVCMLLSLIVIGVVHLADGLFKKARKGRKPAQDKELSK